MAVIVKGNIPSCCGFCCECLGGGSDAYYCNRAKRQISEVVPPYDKRMEWCPIIGEIPDSHGDLKDEMDMINCIERIADDDLAQDIIGEILASPTIVEATE